VSSVNDWLTGLMDTPLVGSTPAERRAARITAAEAALADGWVGELPAVLDMLGLGAA
jgi:hypothetical protein